MTEILTIRNSEPQAQGEAPQKVFEQKRAIIKFNQIIWYILGLIEVLLVFRFVMKAIGASQTSGFTNFIYSITAPLALPFRGIVGVFVSGNSVIEWSTVIAGAVYLTGAWGLVYLIELLYPISPNDVEK